MSILRLSCILGSLEYTRANREYSIKSVLDFGGILTVTETEVLEETEIVGGESFGSFSK
jgi:hypothetical protein